MAEGNEEIVVSGKSYSINTQKLICASPYFEVLCSGRFRGATEKNDGLLDLQVPCPETFPDVLAYIEMPTSGITGFRNTIRGAEEAANESKLLERTINLLRNCEFLQIIDPASPAETSKEILHIILGPNGDITFEDSRWFSPQYFSFAFLRSWIILESSTKEDIELLQLVMKWANGDQNLTLPEIEQLQQLVAENNIWGHEVCSYEQYKLLVQMKSHFPRVFTHIVDSSRLVDYMQRAFKMVCQESALAIALELHKVTWFHCADCGFIQDTSHPCKRRIHFGVYRVHNLHDGARSWSCCGASTAHQPGYTFPRSHRFLGREMVSFQTDRFSNYPAPNLATYLGGLIASGFNER